MVGGGGRLREKLVLDCSDTNGAVAGGGCIGGGTDCCGCVCMTFNECGCNDSLIIGGSGALGR